MGDGPNITEQAMRDYLNDQLVDPVTQQWLDQTFAAADGARELVGIPPNDELTMQTEAARALAKQMWARIIEGSADNVCEHLAARPLQPTFIGLEAHRQMCAECAREWEVPEWFDKSRYHECEACGEEGVIRPWWDEHGPVYGEVYQWWHYVALVILCNDCERTMHKREDLPPAIRDGVVELRRQKRNTSNA